MEKMKKLEKKKDYIWCIKVYPTLLYFLSYLENITIKLQAQNYRYDFISLFKRYTHYIVTCESNPNNANAFTSTCLDRIVCI